MSDKKREEETIYSKLRRLFQSGPIVKRKVRAYKQPTSTTAYDIFKKNVGRTYSNAMSSYGQYDRLCIALDTLIAVPEECGFKTLKELIELYPNGEKFIVYAYDHEKKSIVPAWAHHPRSSGVKQTVKVTFDDGTHLICTPDHPCMLRDGSYRDAGELKSGDSMMPFYRYSNKKGYRTINLNRGGRGGHPKEHTVIAEWFNNCKVNDDECVHHKDFNPSNNSPENLQILTKEAHGKLHLDLANNFWKNQDNILKIRQANLNAWAERHDERIKLLREGRWSKTQKEEYSRYMLSLKETDEGKARIAKFTHYWSGRERPQEWKDARTGAKHHAFITIDESDLVEAVRELKQRKLVAEKLNTSPNTVLRRAQQMLNVSTWNEVIEKCCKLPTNHKVVAVESHLEIEVGDLTVDNYENFCTSTIVVHNSRYSDFQEMQYCLSGDTLIAVPGGFKSIKELAEAYGLDQPFIVYAYDHNKQQIVPAWGKQARHTRTCEAFKVTFDSGKTITGSGNHLLMMSDSTYRRIDQLKTNDKLMPFQSTDRALDIEYSHSHDTSQTQVSGKSSPLPNHWNIRGIVPFSLLSTVADREDYELHRVIEALDVTPESLAVTLFAYGFKTFDAFKAAYSNFGPVNAQVDTNIPAERVISVESVGVQKLYDLTVDGYKNFATDSVISHNTPEISTALDIFSEETTPGDDKNQVLHIYSENRQIKRILEELFYDTLNVEFNLTPWVRNLPVKWDTPIPLLDGRTLTIKDVSAAVNAGEDIWVYSVQDHTHKIVPGKVTWCDKTRENDKILKITVDDGTFYEMSCDHEVMLRDGSKKRADQLSIGESLMPLYTRFSSHEKGDSIKGYEMIYDPSADSEDFVHRIVARRASIDNDQTSGKQVIHHKDFNKRNNNPSNLRKMNDADHWKLHSENAKMLVHKTLLSPEARAKSLVKFLEMVRSDKKRESTRINLRERQARGEMPSWSVYNASDLHKQHNQIRREILCKMWADETLAAERKDKLALKFDDVCVSMLLQKIVAEGHYITKKRISQLLLADDDFMRHLKTINAHSNRNIERAVKHITALISKLDYKTYHDFVADQLPWVKDSKKWQKADRISQKKKQIVNHKIVAIETVGNDDVYCMTVVGQQGEDDRHNFAIAGKRNDGSITRESGIFVKNCAFGDQFLYIDFNPEYGILNALPMPVNEVEREEGFDPKDPLAVRFRWVTQGNAVLENWQVIHFRLLGNDAFLPYGSSVLEPARRVWRQLILLEDAMLVYRIIRSPERRVFYIDVGNIPAEEIPNYMEQARAQLRSSQIIDKNAGRVDLRYNPLCISLNSIIPLQDGRNLTLSEIIEEYNSGKEIWAYSIDRDGKRMVPGKISWAGITRKNAEVVKVHLDDGSYIEVTPDHQVMMRNGEYSKAEDLKPGDSLMPLYRVISDKTDRTRGKRLMNGYELLYDPFNESWEYTHRRNAIATQGFAAIEGGKVVHHIDFNKRNNNPTNLHAMSRQDLKEIVTQIGGLNYIEFSRKYMKKAAKQHSAKVKAGYETREYLNHKVISIERVPSLQDTGCITVDVYHNFAIIGKNENSLPLKNEINLAGGVFIKNSSDEDYFIPTRGGESSSKIESLPGGVNTTAIDDVQYIQAKLFSALKIPKAFLGFDDSIGSKATLCLKGDTRIPLLDGRTVTIKQLADDWAAESQRIATWEEGLGARGEVSPLPEVFSYDHATGQVAAGRVKWCKQTRIESEMAIVTLDNGEKIECTVDHPFMLRSGEYVEAAKLTAGTSLMPFYQRVSCAEMGDYLSGYHMHVEPKSGKWKYTHRVAGKQKFRALTPSNVVHHVNFNKLDNHSSNLFFFRKGADHQNYHADLNRRCKKFVGEGNPRYVKGWTLDRLIEHAAAAETREQLLERAGCSRRVFQRLLSDAGVTYQEFADQHMPLATGTRRCIGYGEVPLDRIVAVAKIERNATKTAAALGITRIVLNDRLRAHGYTGWSEFKHDVVWETTRELLQQRILECGSSTAAFEKYYSNLLSKSGFASRVRHHFGGARQVTKNHSVKSVEIVRLSDPEKFYDLEVEGYHNFAVVTADNAENSLASGVFLHNSQEDIRFSRTINRIQRVVISELNKMAVIHLYANGFEGDDLLDFHLQLSNPSTVAQQQKLEIYRTKLEIAGSAPDGLVDKTWIRKNILNLTDDEIERIEKGRLEDKLADMKIEKATGGAVEGGGGGMGGGGGGGGGAPFIGMDKDMTSDLEGEPGAEGGAEGEPGGPGGEPGAEGGAEAGAGGEGGDNAGEEDEDRKLFSAHVSLGDLLGEDDELPDEVRRRDRRGVPVTPHARVRMESMLSSVPRSRKPQTLTESDIEAFEAELDEADAADQDDAQEFTQQQRYRHNRSRRRHSGAQATSTVDHKRMVNHERPGDSLTDPYDTHRVNQTDPFKEAAQRSVNRFLSRTADAQMRAEIDVSALVKSLSEGMKRVQHHDDDDVELEPDDDDSDEIVQPTKLRDL